MKNNKMLINPKKLYIILLLVSFTTIAFATKDSLTPIFYAILGMIFYACYYEVLK